MPLRTTLFLLFLLLTAGGALAQDGPSLVDLQARYDRLGGLRATFTQVLASDFAGDSSQIEGRVLLAGNKYRVETPGETLVSNGTTTWIYTPADSQVVVNDADGASASITPQTFLRESAARYEVSARRTVQREGAPHDVLVLTAATDSARFQEASLWVRRSDEIVTRLRATDRNGSTLDLRLHEITVDPDLAGRPFRFTAPEGVEVVDLRRNASE